MCMPSHWSEQSMTELDAAELSSIRKAHKKNNPNKRLLYRVSEAAEVLGVSRSKAYDLVHRRIIPSIKLGDSLRVPVSTLEAWIDEQTNDAIDEALWGTRPRTPQR